jgi:hypothetical protein
VLIAKTPSLPLARASMEAVSAVGVLGDGGD